MNSTIREWLARRYEPKFVRGRMGSLKRLEDHYGDLDQLYDQDEFVAVLENLSYSKEDERRDRPNPSRLEIDGDLYTNLAHYRSTLNLYSKFREGVSETEAGEDPWDRYLGRAAQTLDDGSLDRDERYKDELGAAVSAARLAVLADSEGWPQLFKDAIAHPKNNLIHGRKFKGKESGQERLARWVDQNPEDARHALRVLWAEDDRTVGERVRSFDEALPDDVFSKGARSARLDAVSYLMMGLDADRFPPYRRSSFFDTYTCLGYQPPSTDDIGDEYDHALRFLDNLQSEARKRGMERPSTRLDAQSVVWALRDKLEGNGRKDPNPITPPSTAATTYALNTILYGPPGTGKTYATVRRCVEICDGEAPRQSKEQRARYGALTDEGRIEFVTFHQSYGYEEFVEGLRPVVADAGGMRLEVVEGILKRIAEYARRLPKPHVLVVDEINRANISKVMGELITLLEDDKRDGADNEVSVTLPYSHDRFTLPANLYLLGTMNTADRSIALLDTALRRRFHFEEMAPQPGLLEDAARRTDIDLPGVLRAMNERLEYLVDRDHLIGHAWLMEAETRNDVDTAMRRKIIPLIAEYFYDDWSKVQSVLGGTDHFVERQRLSTPPGLESDLGEARFRWTVRETFPDDAYEHLVRPAPVAPDETAE